MKKLVTVAKKSYSKILTTDDAVNQIRQKQDNLENRLAELIAKVDEMAREIDDRMANEAKIAELRFDALFKKTGETPKETSARFFNTLQCTNESLRVYQLGNARLLKVFIEYCSENNLTYFAQSGTLLGAVRHHGFVPWDDDTDVAMFRDDIVKLKNILSTDKNYQITLVYDYHVKSRQMRFRTRDPENPCFLDVYIYDYGSSSSSDSWKRWHSLKDEISSKLEAEDQNIIEQWRQTPLASEDSELGKRLKPLFEKYYDPLLPKNIDKSNYSAVCWALDNFSVKWNRLFDKDFIFPTVPMEYEKIKIQVPKEYDKYLQRQYGDIYKLPHDLVSHYKHIDQDSINVEAIQRFLNKK